MYANLNKIIQLFH